MPRKLSINGRKQLIVDLNFHRSGKYYTDSLVRKAMTDFNEK